MFLFRDKNVRILPFAEVSYIRRRVMEDDFIVGRGKTELEETINKRAIECP